MTSKTPPYLVMNSEYEIFKRGELLTKEDFPDWENPPAELAPLIEAGNWIGCLIRNWTEGRKGGKFSQITNACWLFCVLQEEAGGPVSITVYTEFGRYRTDSEGGEAPDRLEVYGALEALRGNEESIVYKVVSLDGHPDYFLFEMITSYPAGKESLWSEMNRVSDSLPDHNLLGELCNWIL